MNSRLTLFVRVLLFNVLVGAGSAHAHAPPATSNQRFGAFLGEIADLEEPAAAAIGTGGEVYVVEAFRHRVSVFDRERHRVREFGGRGTEPGKLLDPRGIAIAPDGEIYVSDTGNHRVQAFDRSGRFLRTVGIHGSNAAEFDEPLGIAVDKDRLYVCDSRNHRLQVFDRGGVFERTIGHFGGGPGELDHPADVAVDEHGRLFVADRDNHRIQKLDGQGRFIASWGSFGPYLGQMASPSGVRFANDRVYVADRDNHRVEVFDVEGKLLYDWGVHALRPHEGAGKLHYPNQVAVAPMTNVAGAPGGKVAGTPGNDLVIVTEGFENRCQLFGLQDETQALAAQSSERNTASHYGSAIDATGDLVVLLEPSAPGMLVCDTTTDEPIEITRRGAFGAKFGEFVRPEGIALDASGGLAYVSDPGAERVSVWNVARKSGEVLRYDPGLARLVSVLDLHALFALEKNNEGMFPIEPGPLECDEHGNVYLLDLANTQIVVLDPGLSIARRFGSFGSGDAKLHGPTDLALSRSGEAIFVVDAHECRVKAFDLMGRPLFAFGSSGDGPGQFVRPFGIACAADGSIFVSDEGAHRIDKFDAHGGFVAAFGKQGLGRVEFFKPRGISIDRASRLVVVDYGNHRGQTLTADGGFVNAFGARLFTQATRARQ